MSLHEEIASIVDSMVHRYSVSNKQFAQKIDAIIAKVRKHYFYKQNVAVKKTQERTIEACLAAVNLVRNEKGLHGDQLTAWRMACTKIGHEILKMQGVGNEP